MYVVYGTPSAYKFIAYMPKSFFSVLWKMFSTRSGCSAKALKATIIQQFPREPYAISSGMTPLGPHNEQSGKRTLARFHCRSQAQSAMRDSASYGQSAQYMASEVGNAVSVNFPYITSPLASNFSLFSLYSVNNFCLFCSKSCFFASFASLSCSRCFSTSFAFAFNIIILLLLNSAYVCCSTNYLCALSHLTFIASSFFLHLL